ncbi:MAG: aminotransferase class I/II-fold pyridoxal phosphate-dependent enzyme [Candidatus Brocadiaceae bacterium]|nr:aminotransferase class I/II-fold pyridoxal phosphate-dependent enzyme [Candidatus Brocadiaceae bacterium]
MNNNHLSDLIAMQDISIRKAMDLMDRNAKGILFVVDNEEKICGVVTDGDIRRGLLKNILIDDKLTTVMNRSFIAFHRDVSYATVAEKFGSKYKYIPTLNEEGRIVDYYSFSVEVRIPIAKPSLSGNEAKYLLECVATNWISSQGRFVDRFEKEFAAFIGCKYAVAVANGTVALHLALEAVKIGINDEVIVPSLTFIATANAVTYAGAKVVFADSEMETWNLDCSKIEEKITKRTKAIIPVHLYGQPTRMDEIMEIANKYDLYVIEDAAEAHGAEYKGQKVGGIGHIGVFSFFGNKIITTGEGGMLVTDDEEIYQRARILRDHGMDPIKKYWHPFIGFNYRMTNIQSAIGCAQMEKVEVVLQKKLQIAQIYEDCLHDLENVLLPPRNDWSKNVYWMYAIVLVDELARKNIRDALICLLQKKQIECRPFFHLIHHMPPYQISNLKMETAEYLSSNGICLPSYVDMEESETRHVCVILKQLISEI